MISDPDVTCCFMVEFIRGGPALNGALMVVGLTFCVVGGGGMGFAAGLKSLLMTFNLICRWPCFTSFSSHSFNPVGSVGFFIVFVEVAVVPFGALGLATRCRFFVPAFVCFLVGGGGSCDSLNSKP